MEVDESQSDENAESGKTESDLREKE
jgi:hypothetical protein